MSLNRPICILTLLLVCIPAHAKPASIPKIPKNPSTLALELATSAILQGIGWVMDEGVKTHKIPDTATADNTHTDAPSVGTDAQIKPQVHSLEYLIAGKSFGSAEDACNYMFGEYLTKNGYKLTRRKDGTYLKSVDVYLGHNLFSSMGFFRCHANIGYAGTDYDYNIGGWTTAYDGNIVLKGTDSTVRVSMTDAYKQRRDEARKAVEQAIINALPVPVPDDQPLPGETDLPNTKPTPVPVPVPDDLPTVAPNDPAKPETKPETKPKQPSDETKPQDESKPFELPEFCKWSSWFCEGDIDKKDTDIDIDEMPIPTNSVNISFGGSCPTPQNFSFSIGGRSMVFSMSFDSLCRIATSFGGIVKIISTIIAAYILTGIKS